jgi:hypothetical protein
MLVVGFNRNSSFPEDSELSDSQFSESFFFWLEVEIGRLVICVVSELKNIGLQAEAIGKKERQN